MKFLHDSVDDIDKNISVNDIIIENRVNPINQHDSNEISMYYENLRKAGLIDLINYGHYYDKNKYDFYFDLGDASRNWYKKIVLKSTIADLVLKYRIINFLVQEHCGYW
jgi:hypothetical protein